MWMISSILLYAIFQSGIIKSVIDGNSPNQNSVAGSFYSLVAGLILLFTILI